MDFPLLLMEGTCSCLWWDFSLRFGLAFLSLQQSCLNPLPSPKANHLVGGKTSSLCNRIDLRIESFSFRRSGVGPDNLHLNQFAGDEDAVGGRGEPLAPVVKQVLLKQNHVHSSNCLTCEPKTFFLWPCIEKFVYPCFTVMYMWSVLKVFCWVHILLSRALYILGHGFMNYSSKVWYGMR